MGEQSNEEVVRRYVEAHRVHDYETVGELRHADWIQEWPQMGERVRGHANDQAIMDDWPGGLPWASRSGCWQRGPLGRDAGQHGPSNRRQRRHVVGGRDGELSDGATWFFAALLTLRDGLLHRETWYFAPPRAPAWRSAWVERIG